MSNQTSRRSAQPLRASVLAAVAVALLAGACSSSSGSDDAGAPEKAATTTAPASTTTAGGEAEEPEASDEPITVWEVPEDQMVLPATMATETRPADGFEGPDGGLWTGIDEKGDEGRFGVVEPDGTERWMTDSTSLAGGTLDVDEDGLAYEVDDEVVLLDADGDEEWSVELTEGSEVQATALTESFVLVQGCPDEKACGWSAIDRGAGEAGPLFTVEQTEDDVTYERPASGYAPIGEVDGRLLFVSSESQTTIAFDLASGDFEWSGGEAFISPEGTLVSEGFVLDEDGLTTVAYEPKAASDTSTMLTEDSISLVDEDDDEVWSYDIEPQGTEGVVNNMASTDDVILVESGDELVALERDSGDLVGSVDLDDDTSNIAAAGDAFVVTLDSGRQLVLSFA